MRLLKGGCVAGGREGKGVGAGELLAGGLDLLLRDSVRGNGVVAPAQVQGVSATAAGAHTRIACMRAARQRKASPDAAALVLLCAGALACLHQSTATSEGRGGLQDLLVCSAEADEPDHVLLHGSPVHAIRQRKLACMCMPACAPSSCRGCLARRLEPARRCRAFVARRNHVPVRARSSVPLRSMRMLIEMRRPVERCRRRPLSHPARPARTSAPLTGAPSIAAVARARSQVRHCRTVALSGTQQRGHDGRGRRAATTGWSGWRQPRPKIH